MRASYTASSFFLPSVKKYQITPMITAPRQGAKKKLTITEMIATMLAVVMLEPTAMLAMLPMAVLETTEVTVQQPEALLEMVVPEAADWLVEPVAVLVVAPLP